LSDQGSFEAGLFRVVGGCRQNPLDNLRKHHMIVIDRCCMCKRDGEFVNHLFHCDVASAL